MDTLTPAAVAAVFGPLLLAAIGGLIAMYARTKRLDTEVSRNEAEIGELRQNQREIATELGKLAQRVDSGFQHTRELFNSRFDQLEDNLDK